MTILSKKEMSEEDIKLQYITPAILAKWDKNRITMETKITDGKICLNGNFVHRGSVIADAYFKHAEDVSTVSTAGNVVNHILKNDFVETVFRSAKVEFNSVCFARSGKCCVFSGYFADVCYTVVKSCEG